jgi:hypothetical protein
MRHVGNLMTLIFRSSCASIVSVVVSFHIRTPSVFPSVNPLLFRLFGKAFFHTGELAGWSGSLSASRASQQFDF